MSDGDVVRDPGRCPRCDVPVRDVNGPCWACGPAPTAELQPAEAAAGPGQAPWAEPTAGLHTGVRPAVVVGIVLGAVVVAAVVLLLAVTLVGTTTDVRTASAPDAAGLVPTSLTAVASTTTTVTRGPVIATGLGGAEVDAAFSELWKRRENALATHDGMAVRVLEADPALLVDQCSCHDPTPLPLDEHSVFVSPGGFPATVLGVGLTKSAGPSGRPAWHLLVMHAEAPGTPWVVVHATSYVRSAVEHGVELYPMQARDGTNVIPAPSAPAAEAGRELADVAAYLAAVKRTGAPPRGTDITGPLLDDTVAALAQSRNGTVHRNGLIGRWTFAHDTSLPTYRFGLNDGNVVTCGTLRTTAVWTSATPGAKLEQSGADLPWGRGLDPGSYGAVATDRLDELCVASSPARNNGLVLISGAQAEIGAHAAG
jgi:hypothetical protein